jgi:hypothetical protein
MMCIGQSAGLIGVKHLQDVCQVRRSLRLGCGGEPLLDRLDDLAPDLRGGVRPTADRVVMPVGKGTPLRGGEVLQPRAGVGSGRAAEGLIGRKDGT